MGKLFSVMVLLSAGSYGWAQDLKAIVGAAVVDLEGGEPLRDAVVIVEGERIKAIGPSATTEVPSGAEVIRADDAWLIPGLMNVHVHLGLVLPGKMAAELAGETDVELAYRVADNARQALRSGVTTIRLPGDEGGTGIALAKAIGKGQAEGPRIFSAGEMVGITAGHGTRNATETFDGPEELMKAVRTRVREGASWIKIAISGGIASQGGDIAEALMTPEEISAVIDSAHRYGRKVTAHSGSPQATRVAVDAGIDCIEHGYFLDRETLQKMKAEGTWFVPTIVVSQPATLPFFERIGSPPWYLERLSSVGKEHWKALQMAIEEGVPIALGTDQLPHEPNDGTTATIREAQHYVEAGMSPLRALRAATIEPAKLLGASQDTGSLEAGKFADVLAVPRDPTQDIKALREIRFVMKGGKVYRNELGSSPRVTSN
ncbi:MAG: amidohydrolase family protein [Vicinamibacteria bacterium]